MSNPPPNYLVDTSVFVQAHRKYYSFNLCPGFWKSVVWFNKEGKVFSLDKVKQDILAGREEDPLKQWAKSAMKFEPSTDLDVVAWYAKMQQWAQAHPQYTDAAKAEFASVSDAWIIAFAKAKNLTLVTDERYDAKIKRRIKIPNVCKAPDFSIACITTFDMLKALGVKFDWQL